MRRREFISLSVGVVVGCPLVAHSQPEKPTPRIGVLMGYPEADVQAQANVVALQDGLKRLGRTDGGNVHIDHRWAGGDAEKARAFAKELVALKSNVIVPSTNQVTEIVQQET